VPAGPHQRDGQAVAQRLGAALPGIVTGATAEWVEVDPERVTEALRWLHDSEEFDAAQLSNLTAVDRHTSFEVVYHLQSLDLNHQVVVKALVRDHEAPSLPSAYPVYKGALLQEREVYDLMGIRFAGHPDLRRLLLWEAHHGPRALPERGPGAPRPPAERGQPRVAGDAARGGRRRDSGGRALA
jgi:NADH-quinone oxidoreductase subunit C